MLVSFLDINCPYTYAECCFRHQLIYAIDAGIDCTFFFNKCALLFIICSTFRLALAVSEIVF